MTTTALGTIQTVNVRTVWSSESEEFTHWLAEPANIALLSQTIGVDLDTQAVEKRVGAFRADILCKDDSGNLVLIENQLERSDHGHLGQLLTYASGLDTATIVWITPEFSDEHRAAIDWLNRITETNFRFFAVKLEVWSISGSLPAPRFSIVAAPNNWNRSIRRVEREVEANRSEAAERRYEYWTTFLSKLRLDDRSIAIPKPNSLGNLRFILDGNRFWITVYAGSSLKHMGVFLRGSAEYFAAIEADRPRVEVEVPDATWNEDTEQWSVEVTRPADPTCVDEWPAQHKWLADTLERFLKIFKPFVGTVSAPIGRAE
jgi:hypothetical protein